MVERTTELGYSALAITGEFLMAGAEQAHIVVLKDYAVSTSPVVALGTFQHSGHGGLSSAFANELVIVITRALANFLLEAHYQP
ncbi:MAG: hypothetical protein ACK4OE_01780 [Acidovorax sp.]|uniref:hypothetical protein n=1 Tax=Acidovorax sp. TaxID=1872122 RepID=UPI00391B7543